MTSSFTGLNFQQSSFFQVHNHGPLMAGFHYHQANQYPGSSATCSSNSSSQQKDDDQNDKQPCRQWPWRIFAFLSDLGTIGVLIKKRWMGALGWSLAIPYYAYALIHQPDSKSRKEEALYQVTANGILPFMAAKAGITLGDKVYQQFGTKLANHYPHTFLSKLSHPMYKGIGGLLALLVLTPTVNDPLSHKFIKTVKPYLDSDNS
jgi:hypothetical protein